MHRHETREDRPPARGGPSRPGLARRVARLLAGSTLLLALGLGLVGGAAGPAGPAGAQAGTQCGNPGSNPRLTVSPATVPAGSSTTITVSGADYMVPGYVEGRSVFGGAYVFFGWVADADRFGPSIRNPNDNDGTPGVTYAYPGESGDGDTRDDGSGLMRLVSFTASGMSGDATDYHMSCQGGNWTTTLKVPGPTFSFTTPGGEVQHYDCRALARGRCGVFSIGAHGVANARNERFTPITFASTPTPPTQPPVTTGPPASHPTPGTQPGPGPRPNPQPIAPGPNSSPGTRPAPVPGTTTPGPRPISPQPGRPGSGDSPPGSTGDPGSPDDPDDPGSSEVAGAPTPTPSDPTGSPATDERAEGPALVVGISETRSTGGGRTLLVTGLAGGTAALAAAGAVAVRTRRRSTTDVP